MDGNVRTPALGCANRGFEFVEAVFGYVDWIIGRHDPTARRQLDLACTLH